MYNYLNYLYNTNEKEVDITAWKSLHKKKDFILRWWTTTEDSQVKKGTQ